MHFRNLNVVNNCILLKIRYSRNSPDISVRYCGYLLHNASNFIAMRLWLCFYRLYNIAYWNKTGSHFENAWIKIIISHNTLHELYWKYSRNAEMLRNTTNLYIALPCMLAVALQLNWGETTERPNKRSFRVTAVQARQIC
jgi:hypothetical protein